MVVVYGFLSAERLFDHRVRVRYGTPALRVLAFSPPPEHPWSTIPNKLLEELQARIEAAKFTGEKDRPKVNKQVDGFMWLISRGVEQAVEQRLAQTTGLRWLSFGMRRKTHPLPPAETGAGISMSGPKKEAWN